ncbi:MAG: hypothetical protein KAJ19_16140, partial [Gammaproteobacteria bacterium]|nr:hypothetical protein [Gammaproteobacteria bacterium]
MLWQQYKYIEVKYDFIDPAGNIQSSKWRRILAADLGRWLDANQGKVAYFHTIQTFKLAHKEQDEEHIAPFYIDLDADDLSGERSPVEMLEESLRDARLVVDYFADRHEVVPSIWFSGNRGFHITVDPMAFGAAPNSVLTYHWRHVADGMARELVLETLDKRVYSRPRVWRIEATRHAKSGLFKTRLSVHEVRSMDAAGIRELAKETREMDTADSEQAEEARPGLVTLYKKAVAEYTDRQKRYESDEDIEYV